MLKFLILSLLFQSSFSSTPDHWKFVSQWDNTDAVFGNQCNDLTMVVPKSFLKGRVRKGGKLLFFLCWWVPIFLTPAILWFLLPLLMPQIVSVTQKNLWLFTTACLIKQFKNALKWTTTILQVLCDQICFALSRAHFASLSLSRLQVVASMQNCTGWNFFTETSSVSLCTGF